MLLKKLRILVFVFNLYQPAEKSSSKQQYSGARNAAGKREMLLNEV